MIYRQPRLGHNNAFIGSLPEGLRTAFISMPARALAAGCGRLMMAYKVSGSFGLSAPRE